MEGDGDLEICIAFVDSILFKQDLLFIFADGGVGWGVTKLVVFCGRHTCMTPYGDI